MLPFLIAPLLFSPVEAKSRWESTIEEVTPAIVSIKLSSTRSFDTEGAGNSQGTGFVVDAKKGLILTNRHLVEPGPVVAEAIFLNNEEVPLRAIYRDPVHDFGFYQFDPEALEFMKLKELDLNPKGARVGVEIRLIGNDEGEKISILSGTLARLDRAAPKYGRGYNDFNTFYIQAASGTSGGSSGSPVLNKKGDVIALNAGGSRRGASSFYLPLHRVVRALQKIQDGEEVSRGTLQWTLDYTPFDELRRLGLQHETEALVRKTWKEGTGMLVVRDVLPEGPAGDSIETGDILTHIDGKPISTFLPLETLLDERVGQKVDVRIERVGKVHNFSLTVDDLHELSPSEFMEIGGGIIHPLSYQKARHHAIAVKGLFVASPGYMLNAAGIPDSALIREVDGKEVASLDEIWEILKDKPDGEMLPIRYAAIHESWREQMAAVRMDHKWFAMRRCNRNDVSGLWDCIESDTQPQKETIEARSAHLQPKGPDVVSKLSQSLVMVDYDIPHRAEGVYGTSFRGAGVIFDTEQGLVLVDRDTVPIALGDCSITFAGSLRVPGKVEFVHPIHNMAVISYDPKHIGETNVLAAPFAEKAPQPGDSVWQVGLSSRFQTVWRETRVARVEALVTARTSPPHFRDINVEAIRLDEYTPSVGGMLTNDKGQISALWASYRSDDGGDSSSFFRGLPVEFLRLILDPMKAGTTPNYRILGAEFRTMSLADAQDMGLPEEDAKAFEEAEPDRRQILGVSRQFAGTAAEVLLEGGDLILQVNGKRVNRFAELESITQTETVEIVVLRDGERKSISLPTAPAGGLGIDRVIQWQGALMHQPHFDLATQREIAPVGVYISFYSYGSPASRFGLRATRRIVEVDSTATLDLDSFLKAIAHKKTGDSVRIKAVGLDNQVHVDTLKIDQHYWPTFEFRLEDGVWTRHKH